MVRRYDLWQVAHEPKIVHKTNGDYVLYSDYMELQEAVDNIRTQLSLLEFHRDECLTEDSQMEYIIHTAMRWCDNAMKYGTIRVPRPKQEPQDWDWSQGRPRENGADHI